MSDHDVSPLHDVSPPTESLTNSASRAPELTLTADEVRDWIELIRSGGLTSDRFAELIVNHGPYSREELLEKTEIERRDYLIVISSAVRREPGFLFSETRRNDFRGFTERCVWGDDFW